MSRIKYLFLSLLLLSILSVYIHPSQNDLKEIEKYRLIRNNIIEETGINYKYRFFMDKVSPASGNNDFIPNDLRNLLLIINNINTVKVYSVNGFSNAVDVTGSGSGSMFNELSSPGTVAVEFMGNSYLFTLQKMPLSEQKPKEKPRKKKRVLADDKHDFLSAPLLRMINGK